MNAIILAHRGAAATVLRHTPNWLAAFDALTFISPADDPLPCSMPIGQSCRNGQGAIERLLFAICMASRFDECAILEYDTLVFPQNLNLGASGEPTTFPFGNWASYMNIGRNQVLCSEKFNTDDLPEVFSAPTYGHCPWVATGETWWKLLTAGSDAQRGFPDRWLANAAQRAGVGLRGMDGAYSWDRDFVAADARAARLAGAPCIHGIKTAEQFEEVMRD